MQLISNEKWLAAVSGGGENLDFDDPVQTASEFFSVTPTSTVANCTAASYNSDMAPINQAAANAQAAQIAEDAKPGFSDAVSLTALSAQTAAAGCAGAVSTAGTMAKLAAVTGAGQVGNLVLCSAGALSAALLKR